MICNGSRPTGAPSAYCDIVTADSFDRTWSATLQKHVEKYARGQPPRKRRLRLPMRQRDPGVQNETDNNPSHATELGVGIRIRRAAMLNCPLCHSERIHRSRRRGIVERRILTMVFLRPFRCDICDFRFFRWSITTNPNSPSRATTS